MAGAPLTSFTSAAEALVASNEGQETTWRCWLTQGRASAYAGPETQNLNTIFTIVFINEPVLPAKTSKMGLKTLRNIEFPNKSCDPLESNFLP